MLQAVHKSVSGVLHERGVLLLQMQLETAEEREEEKVLRDARTKTVKKKC